MNTQVNYLNPPIVTNCYMHLAECHDIVVASFLCVMTSFQVLLKPCMPIVCNPGHLYFCIFLSLYPTFLDFAVEATYPYDESVVMAMIMISSSIQGILIMRLDFLFVEDHNFNDTSRQVMDLAVADFQSIFDLYMHSKVTKEKQVQQRFNNCNRQTEFGSKFRFIQKSSRDPTLPSTSQTPLTCIIFRGGKIIGIIDYREWSNDNRPDELSQKKGKKKHDI